MKTLSFRCGAALIAIAVASSTSATRAQDTNPPTRGPYLQSLLADSVVVLWRTEFTGLGGVRLRPADGAGGEVVVEETERRFDHEVRLGGLSPGTSYLYRLLDEETPQGDEHRFRTAPLAGAGPFRAAVIGDSGVGDKDQAAVADVIASMAPDLFLHTGDISYIGNYDISVFWPYRSILPVACLYPTAGNHDTDTDLPILFRAPIPIGALGYYYSFDWGSAHFAALDTESDWLVGGDQMAWLEADLEAARARGSAWTILFFHRPPFTIGWYAGEDQIYRKPVIDIIDRFAVDLVLNGHDHNYQRTYPVRDLEVRDAAQDPSYVSPRGTIYLVTGGGGAPLYPEEPAADHRFAAVFRREYHALQLDVAPARLSVRAVSKTGALLDSFTITKGPEPRFLRGDADGSRSLDLNDAVAALEYLFRGGSIGCASAADTDGSGAVDVTDPIALLGWLFQGRAPPPEPFPRCGPAPSDGLGCGSPGC